MQPDVGVSCAAAANVALSASTAPQISFVFIAALPSGKPARRFVVARISSHAGAAAYRGTVRHCSRRVMTCTGAATAVGETTYTARYCRGFVMNVRAARALLLLLCTLAASALAQTFPSRPLRIVVPWPPGGVTDVLTRAVAVQMGDSLGQPVMMESRPGAGGTLGIAVVAKSPADGYTLVMTDVPSHAISASLYAKLPYDPEKDFEAIAMVAGSPMVLATHPGMGAKNLAEFLQILKANPGKYSYASSGNGAITHLAMERLKRMAGLDLTHIPFKGTVPAVQSVLAGDTAMGFGTIPGVAPQAKAGKLVLLGVSFARRFPQLPEVAPIAEQVPG